MMVRSGYRGVDSVNGLGARMDERMKKEMSSELSKQGQFGPCRSSPKSRDKPRSPIDLSMAFMSLIQAWDLLVINV